MGGEFEEQIKELGFKLQTLPSSKDDVIKLVKQAADLFSEMEQSPVLELMQPFLNSIVKPELLKHQDKEVSLLVAFCLCKITRIPLIKAHYSVDVLKDIFHLFVGTFSGLNDTGGPSFGRRVSILVTFAKYSSFCSMMLKVDSHDLVNKMFSTFFEVARDAHQINVLSSMLTIMVRLIKEIKDVEDDLLHVILYVLGRNINASAAARILAMNVIENCAAKLEAGIKQYLLSSMSADDKSPVREIDYHEVIYDVYCCAPKILSWVVPFLLRELSAGQVETRLKAVEFVGNLFALQNTASAEVFQPLFSEFLKRSTDPEVCVRMSVLERARLCLLSNPPQPVEAEICSVANKVSAVDKDLNVRIKALEIIYDLVCYEVEPRPIIYRMSY